MGPAAVFVDVGQGADGVEDVAGCEALVVGIFDDVAGGQLQVAIAQSEKAEGVGVVVDGGSAAETPAVAIVVLTVGIVIVSILQWRAMSDQLAEMRNGGQDTHALAVAAGEQADKTRDLAERTKDIADQAVIQAKASKQLAQNAVDALHMGYRPWISAQTADLMQPIVFPPKDRFYLRVNFVLKNTGTSIATDGLAITEVDPNYLITTKELMTKNFRKTCDDTQKMEAAVRQVTPWATGFILAPGDTLATPVGMGSDNIPNGAVKNGSFYVLGCVLYRDQFKIKHHTLFCFLPNGPITDPNVIEFKKCNWHEEAD